MIRYVARRCVTAVLMIVICSAVIFVMLRVLPGDPTSQMQLAGGVSTATIEKIRGNLGLNHPLYVQYLNWIAGVVHGNLGKSFVSQFPVTQVIGQRLGSTFELAVSALLVAAVIALVLSVLPAIRDSRIVGILVTEYTVLGLSMPAFLIGIIIKLVFGNWLGWIPNQTYNTISGLSLQNLRLLVAPAFTLGIAVSAGLINYMRASLRDAEEESFVRTAFGAGIGRSRVVIKHMLPNVFMPVLTSFGLTVAAALGGVVEVEYVFGWPGLGSTLVNAVNERDYGIVQSVVLLAAVVLIVVNLIVDLLYGVLDPRLRVAARPKSIASPLVDSEAPA